MLLTPALTLNLGDLVLGVLNLLPVTLCITGLTVLLSTLLRSRGAVSFALERDICLPAP